LVTFGKRIVGLNASAIERFVLRVRRLLRMREQVNVLVTSSAELRSLNRRFRGFDKPTDVLSFPALRMGSSQLNSVAGEVVISADIARENAKGLDHSLEAEVKILALHGMLHLAGYDHERDTGQMARKESRLRRQFKLEAALIERTGAHSANLSHRKSSIRKQVTAPRFTKLRRTKGRTR
jgi:probable rRNA maturation factor